MFPNLSKLEHRSVPKEDDLLEVLQEECLTQFYYPLKEKLMITKLRHLRFTSSTELCELGFSDPSARRLLYRANKGKPSKSVVRLAKIKEWFSGGNRFDDVEGSDRKKRKVVSSDSLPDVSCSWKSSRLDKTARVNSLIPEFSNLTLATKTAQRLRDEIPAIDQRNAQAKTIVSGDLIDLTDGVQNVVDFTAANVMTEEQNHRYENVDAFQNSLSDSEESVEDFDSDLADLVADVNLNLENENHRFAHFGQAMPNAKGLVAYGYYGHPCKRNEKEHEATAPPEHELYGLTQPPNYSVVQQLMSEVKIASKQDCIEELSICSDPMTAVKNLKIKFLNELGLGDLKHCEASLRANDWDLSHAASSMVQ